MNVEDFLIEKKKEYLYRKDRAKTQQALAEI